MIKRHCVAFYNKIKNTQLAFKKMKVSRVFYIPDGVARASDSRLLLTAFLRHRAALHVLHRPDWPPWSGVSTYNLLMEPADSYAMSSADIGVYIRCLLNNLY